MKPLDCTGCVACCNRDMIFLHPECGDIVEFYETDIVEGGYALKHKKDLTCIYLTKTGCGIYDVRPTICRGFDCRIIVKKLGYTKFRKLAKKGMLNMVVLQAAMRRMK